MHRLYFVSESPLSVPTGTRMSCERVHLASPCCAQRSPAAGHAVEGHHAPGLHTDAEGRQNVLWVKKVRANESGQEKPARKQAKSHRQRNQAANDFVITVRCPRKCPVSPNPFLPSSPPPPSQASVNGARALCLPFHCHLRRVLRSSSYQIPHRPEILPLMLFKRPYPRHITINN